MPLARSYCLNHILFQKLSCQIILKLKKGNKRKKKERKMEVKPKTETREESLEQIDIWNYVFGFTPMAIVKCAIELQIPDVLESHGGSMTHSELSAAINCSSTALRRIMRYLTHRRIFKQTPANQDSSSIRYTQTPLSRLLMRTGSNSMAGFVLLESSQVMLAPWHGLSARTLANEAAPPPFEAANGEDVWKYAAANPGHSKLINEAMACHARVAISAIVDQYPEAFMGVGSLVDVGGGDGTSVGSLVKACPWITRAINFDLPHVVSVALRCDAVEHVGGDMFQSVPKADVAFLMWVLHDWSDDECITILRNCRDAIPKDNGKVIIAEAVIEEGEEYEDDKYDDVRLALDMVMLAHTEKGKERTLKEWGYVLNSAGFSRYTVKRIDAIVAVIEAYP